MICCSSARSRSAPVEEMPSLYMMSNSASVNGGATLFFTILMRVRLRSEEHTSELQSRSDLVCRLLLEKKKNEQGDDGRDGRLHRAHIVGFVLWIVVTSGMQT